MSERDCSAEHKHVIERLDRNEKRLNNHSERLDKLEQAQAKFEEKMDHLIRAMEKLDKSIWWLIGLGGTALVSFLMRAIERGLFQ